MILLAQAASWGEFGILGLVIGALFTALGVGAKYGADKVAAIVNDAGETIKGIQAGHATERTEWRESYEEFAQETRAVIRELTAAIAEAQEQRSIEMTQSSEQRQKEISHLEALIQSLNHHN